MDHLYERDGELLVPSAWTGSPWSAEAQHGGPVAGLFARAAEACASEAGQQLARLTVDLFRPVPKQPLRLAQRWVRRGRKLALVEIELSREGEPVARASALSLASRSELGSAWRDATPPPPPLERGEPLEFMPPGLREQWPPGFHLSIQARLARDELGHAIWLTTPLQLVAGELTTPQVRFAMLSDLTFATSTRIGFLRGAVDVRALRTPLINADITLYRERAPEGEWVAFRTSALSDAAGVGVAEVVQFDRAGRIGRSLQALVASS
jgi:antitoxin (DNA-binding transcriptional repressor) of toxin-antitoxin stability system